MNRLLIGTFLGIVFFLMSTSVGRGDPRVVFVDGSVSSSGDGTSWGAAMKTIPEGLSAALPSTFPNLNSVWVKEGTYTLASSSSTIQLEAGVEVYGGFAGGETALEQRNVADNETIISGELDSPGFDDNVEVLVTAPAGNSTYRLDGVTLESARMGIRNTGGGNGTYAFVTVRSCETDDLGARGVGMYCESSSPTIDTCVFEFNRNYASGSASGGGLAIIGGSPIITNSQFNGNEVDHEDGTNGGGGVFIDGATPAFTRCRFSNNFVREGNGGGVFVLGGSPVFFTLCEFDQNQIVAEDDSYEGGGLHSHQMAQLLNCKIWGNTIHDGEGNLLGSGGGVLAQKGAFLVNTEIRDNSAKIGGGIRMTAGHAVTVLNCTIVRNKAGATGGGVHVNSTWPAFSVLQNCIVYQNEAGCATSCTDDEISQVWVAGTNPGVAVTHCDIENFTTSGPFDTVTHLNNFGDDPLFVDPDGLNHAFGDGDDNYRLRPCSGCLDRADSSGLPSDEPNLDGDMVTDELLPDLGILDRAVDLAIANLGDGTPDYVDVGVYELHLLGDVNIDDLLDGRDIQPFTDCYLEIGESGLLAPLPCSNGDMNLDGVLTIADVPCFVDMLLGGSGCFAPCEDGGESRSGFDCNANDVEDAVDIMFCDSDIDPGNCDCNGNGIPDACDIAECDEEEDWTCGDVNGNDVPDGCEPDCQNNHVPDSYDISTEASEDCNSNDVPDECDLDCNENDIPDDCEELEFDCNENGIPDECEYDCDENGVPDDCDLDPLDPDGDEWVDPDCNENGWPDSCDIDEGPPFGSLDANENEIPDECEEEESLMGGGEGGGESMMSGGFTGGTPVPQGGATQCDASYWPADYSVLSNEMYAAWEEFMLWCMQERWGPDSEFSGAEQLERLIAKKEELGICDGGLNEQ